MTQHKQESHQAAKSSHAPHKAASKPDEAISEAKEKVLEMGRGNMENIMHTAQTCSQTAGKLAGICSENVSTMVESGNRASHMAQDVAAEILESSNRAFSDCARIAREAVNCRTASDMIELQNKAIQQLSDNYFTTTNRLCNVLFSTEAREPFYKQAGQARKAMAA